MQGDPDKAVAYSVLTLMKRKQSFLILGPHTSVEATGVLHVVGYFNKLMVRNSKHAAVNCYALLGEPCLCDQDSLFSCGHNCTSFRKLCPVYKGYNCSELISISRVD